MLTLDDGMEDEGAVEGSREGGSAQEEEEGVGLNEVTNWEEGVVGEDGVCGIGDEDEGKPGRGLGRLDEGELGRGKVVEVEMGGNEDKGFIREGEQGEKVEKSVRVRCEETGQELVNEDCSASDDIGQERLSAHDVRQNHTMDGGQAFQGHEGGDVIGQREASDFQHEDGSAKRRQDLTSVDVHEDSDKTVEGLRGKEAAGRDACDANRHSQGGQGDGEEALEFEVHGHVIGTHQSQARTKGEKGDSGGHHEDEVDQGGPGAVQRLLETEGMQNQNGSRLHEACGEARL